MVSGAWKSMHGNKVQHYFVCMPHALISEAIGKKHHANYGLKIKTSTQ